MEGLVCKTIMPVTCASFPSAHLNPHGMSREHLAARSTCAMLSSLTAVRSHGCRPFLASDQRKAGEGRQRRYFLAVHCQASEQGKASTGENEAAVSVDKTLEESSPAPPSPVRTVPEAEGFRSGGKKSRRTADSTDWIASSLTRRFGIAGGLVWAGILAFGAISEQLKTRREVFEVEQGTVEVSEQREVVRANGVRYTDLKVGGGQAPFRGDLVLLSVTGRVLGSEAPFIDGKRPIAFILGSRSLPAGLCQGIVEELFLMKAGAKRRVIIPPELGFGEEGTAFVDGSRVPGDAVLDYLVELQRVSIPPT